MKQLRSISAVLLAVSYVFAFTGCKKEESNSLALPPQNSMSIDFAFTTSTKSASENKTQINHGIAALSVGYWSLIATAQTLVPSAAFKKAFDKSPVYNNDDKVWEWVYETSVGTDTYKSKLTGKLSEDSVQWKMYLSKVGDDNIKNFLWFEGKSHQARTGGWWILNYPRSDGGALVSEQGLKITWSYTSDLVFSLKYLYIANKTYDSVSKTYINNADKGGFIEYGRVNSSKFDSYYTIYSKKELKKYDILWNIKSKAGQIKLNDTQIGCWDTNLVDITCE